MSTNIKIAIAESSAIIRCGLETLLKRLPAPDDGGRFGYRYFDVCGHGSCFLLFL